MTAHILALILYSIVTVLLLRQWVNNATEIKGLTTGTAFLAVLCHGSVLFFSMLSVQGLDIGFFNALSFTAGLMALLLVTASLSQPISCLGLLVYPFAFVSILLSLLYHQPHYLPADLSAGLEAHILLSILAYSLLSIGAAQSILLYIQDKFLHNKHPAGFIRTLPPLETMEILLFRMISIGLIALTLSLLSGFVYLDNMFAQHLVHKTILSMIAWILFATLLWGHKTLGWRGKTAIRWTMSGFVLLMLAYFGSKFVIELILQR